METTDRPETSSSDAGKLTPYGEMLQKLNEDYKDNKMVNGQRIVLRCSNCQLELAELWITKPKVKIRSRVRAYCGRCGDYSFEKVVDGQFHLGTVESKQSKIARPEIGDTYVEDDVIVQNVTIYTEEA